MMFLGDNIHWNRMELLPKRVISAYYLILKYYKKTSPQLSWYVQIFNSQLGVARVAKRKAVILPRLGPNFTL